MSPLSSGDSAPAEIAISGFGIVSPLGDSLSGLLEALRAGRSALRPATDLPDAGEARLDDFDASRYANVRGMRVYNRTTRLGISVAKLALVDAGLDGAGLPGEQLGLVTASTFGHLDTLIEYDRSLVTVGVQRTNPTLMPLGIPSAPGAAIALSFGAKAFSITLSDGGASSLDAIALGVRALRAGRASACLVVGASALCHELSLSASRAGLLSTADDFRVFDRRRRGTAFGEAAAALVLERADDVRSRGATPRGFVRGYASSFASTFGPAPARTEAALRRACAGALRAADSTPAQLSLISAGASGHATADADEARALLGLLGQEAARVPVMAVKANLGEPIDAGGLLQSLAALGALTARTAPPIARLEHPQVPGLRYLTQEQSVDGGGSALITSTSATGACAALVLSAVGDGR